jgi:hypothetical protein
MKKPKRKKGESQSVYETRLANWQIDQAFERKASHLKGASLKRNQHWRTLESERQMFADEDDKW